MKHLFAVALAALALAGCRPGQVDFEIDNPTAAPLTLAIDGRDYTVPANGSTPVSLPPGAHTLRSDALGEVDFIVYAKGRGGLINPTLGEYLTINEIYVTGEDKLRNFGSIDAEVELDGVVFQGPFTKRQALFIDKDWTFGVHEPFPDVQTVAHVDASGGRINRKVFTAQAFIDYVEAGAGQPGAYLRQNPDGYRAPQAVLEPAPATLPPLHPAYEAHAGALREVYASYLRATDPAEQQRLQQASFDALMAMTSATATLGSGLGAQDNQGYNDFVHRHGELMGSSALVPPPAAAAAATP